MSIPQGGTLHYRWTGRVAKDVSQRQVSAWSRVQVMTPGPDPVPANDSSTDTDALLQ